MIQKEWLQWLLENGSLKIWKEGDEASVDQDLLFFDDDLPDELLNKYGDAYWKGIHSMDTEKTCHPGGSWYLAMDEWPGGQFIADCELYGVMVVVWPKEERPKS